MFTKSEERIVCLFICDTAWDPNFVLHGRNALRQGDSPVPYFGYFPLLAAVSPCPLQKSASEDFFNNQSIFGEGKEAAQWKAEKMEAMFAPPTELGILGIMSNKKLHDSDFPLLKACGQKKTPGM